MAEFLFFHLYGPMASWGGIAVGEQRGSYTHPGRSAILGLLAAALGLKRNEEKQHNILQASTGFAVQVNHEGDLLRDFHTTQVPPQKKGKIFRTRKDELAQEKLNTILSQRDYRTDASYTIALWLKNSSGPWSLKDFKQALLEPKFTLYLGRKSCPLALPLSPEIIQVENLYKGLGKMHKLSDSLGLLKTAENKAVYWDGVSFKNTGFPQEALHWQTSRRDVIASRKRWQFSERQEHYVSLPSSGEID